MGLVAPWHVGSSQTRDRTRVPSVGRQILNHCATREVRELGFDEESGPQSTGESQPAGSAPTPVLTGRLMPREVLAQGHPALTGWAESRMCSGSFWLRHSHFPRPLGQAEVALSGQGHPGPGLSFLSSASVSLSVSFCPPSGLCHSRKQPGPVCLPPEGGGWTKAGRAWV